MKHTTKTGFSLIELLITILISSIMLGIFFPSMKSISNEYNFNSLQQHLILDLTYTRSEAINQGGVVTICPSNNNTSCFSRLSDWSHGWIIFSDIDANGIYDPGSDDILRAYEVQRRVAITWSGNNPISFLGSGLATGISTGSFKICDSDGDSSIAKGVSITLNGRIRPSSSVSCP
ncbi:hypothetical protein ACH42_15975 [Endozoicomonas sp. (ex Bugula neritina AB1)]|nr:hypothetical protein ACH42_15975 [Endozoicomonas sp. (ex Bugula neritina AB1)]